VAAAALEVSYLDPVIPDQELYLFRPAHVDLKVRKKGSGIGLSLFHFMKIHERGPFSMTELESSICIWEL
jgi:hypothetical protein